MCRFRWDLFPPSVIIDVGTKDAVQVKSPVFVNSLSFFFYKFVWWGYFVETLIKRTLLYWEVSRGNDTQVFDRD